MWWPPPIPEGALIEFQNRFYLPPPCRSTTYKQIIIHSLIESEDSAFEKAVDQIASIIRAGIVEKITEDLSKKIDDEEYLEKPQKKNAGRFKFMPFSIYFCRQIINNISFCTLHITHYTLQITHYALHITHTLHIAHYILHITYYA